MNIQLAFEIDDKVAYSEKSTFAHNYVRDLHLVDSLAWDPELGKQANEYARILASMNSMEHSVGASKGYYGENIYKGFDGFKNEKSVSDAVYYW